MAEFIYVVQQKKEKRFSFRAPSGIVVGRVKLSLLCISLILRLKGFEESREKIFIIEMFRRDNH